MSVYSWKEQKKKKYICIDRAKKEVNMINGNSQEDSYTLSTSLIVFSLLLLHCRSNVEEICPAGCVKGLSIAMYREGTELFSIIYTRTCSVIMTIVQIILFKLPGYLKSFCALLTDSDRLSCQSGSFCCSHRAKEAY